MKHSIVTVLLVWLLSNPASAEGTARDWFDRMVQAAREQNYEGVLMYGNQRQWDAMSVRHALIDGQEYEHLEQLTGAPREQLRHGERVACRHNEPSGMHPQPLQNPLHGFLSGHDFSGQYELTLGNSDRVAGRFTRQLLLQPKDSHRYAMRLWLDQKTALLLRSDLLDERQQVLERFQFASIRIGVPVTAAAFSTGSSFHPLELQTAHNNQSVSWSPQWLPDGFERLAAVEQGNVIRLLYADGLTAFSVFIDALPQPAAGMDQQWGATSAVVRLVEHSPGMMRRVTAVGELPAATLLQIVQSVRPEMSPEAEQE